MRNQLSDPLVITALAGLLFLAPCGLSRAHAQDNKDAVIKKLKETVERQQKEIDALKTTAADRDTAILQVETAFKLFRTRSSLDQLDRRKNPGQAKLNKPDDPNPPAAKMEGKIQKVDGDLAQISLGTDHGLKEGHTLDVFRTEPQRKYLGMIRITDTYHHTSVGRFTPHKDAKNVKLQKGDLVASTLKPNHELKKDAPPAKKGTQDEVINELREQLDKHRHAVLVAQEQERTIKKQAEEIDRLRKLIKDPDVRRLEAEMKKLRLDAEWFEKIARHTKDQNERLLEQIRELTLALARKNGGGDPGRLKPIEPNPPAKAVEGKITKVDGNLVQINLGTDHGLKGNNTLDVYRMNPQPKYLGMIRITDVYNKTSVGRLLPSSNTARPPMLKEGDVVTSKIK